VGRGGHKVSMVRHSANERQQNYMYILDYSMSIVAISLNSIRPR